MYWFLPLLILAGCIGQQPSVQPFNNIQFNRIGDALYESQAVACIQDGGYWLESMEQKNGRWLMTGQCLAMWNL